MKHSALILLLAITSACEAAPTPGGEATETSGDGDGDSGDGDGDGEPLEYPNCGVEGETTVVSTYVDFDDLDEYQAQCTVAEITSLDAQTTIALDCPDDYHPALVVTAQPAWMPNISVGQALDVQFEPYGSWEEFGSSWALHDSADGSLVATWFDVYTMEHYHPLGMTTTLGLCPAEPSSCVMPEFPGNQHVGVNLEHDGESITVFSGNWTSAGAYDIWLEQATYDDCQASGDAQPGRYRGLFALR
jgi:hypothetical protein